MRRGNSSTCDEDRRCSLVGRSRCLKCRSTDALDGGFGESKRRMRRSHDNPVFDDVRSGYSLKNSDTHCPATTPAERGEIAAANRDRRRSRRTGQPARAELLGSNGEFHSRRRAAHFDSTPRAANHSRTHGNFYLEDEFHFGYFDGDSHIDKYLEWEQYLEESFEYLRISQEEQVHFVVSKLVGRAKVWWKLIKKARRFEGRNDVKSWSKMKRLLRDQFLPTYFNDLFCCSTINSSHGIDDKDIVDISKNYAAVLDDGGFLEDESLETTSNLRKEQFAAHEDENLETKSVNGLFSSFDENPLVTALIAQAHSATPKDGIEIVEKVQHAGIKEVNQEDQQNVEVIVEWMRRVEAQYDFSPMIYEWCRKAPKQLDSNHEAESTIKVSHLCCNKDNDGTNDANDVNVLLLVPLLDFSMHLPVQELQAWNFSSTLETGVTILAENEEPVAQVEKAIGSLRSYDPSRGCHEDSPPFLYWTIRDLAYAYRNKFTTPSSVAKHIIVIVEEYNNKKPPVPLLILFSADEVRKQAVVSTQRFEGQLLSILDGIFVAIKSGIGCYPYPSKSGTSWIHKTREVKRVAVCVARLGSCGVILRGKINMHELGMRMTGRNPIHGTTSNPLSFDRYNDGSSSGPATLVSSRSCSVALGTDGGGLIRISSSLYGIVGLETTYGKIEWMDRLVNISVPLNGFGLVKGMGWIAASHLDTTLEKLKTILNDVGQYKFHMLFLFFSNRAKYEDADDIHDALALMYENAARYAPSTIVEARIDALVGTNMLSRLLHAQHSTSKQAFITVIELLGRAVINVVEMGIRFTLKQRIQLLDYVLNLRSIEETDSFNDSSDELFHTQSLQITYEKLVPKTEIEDYTHINLDLDSFKKMLQEYAKAKEEDIKGESVCLTTLVKEIMSDLVEKHLIRHAYNTYVVVSLLPIRGTMEENTYEETP